MATMYLARVSGLAGFEKLVAIKRIHPHLARERQFIEMFLDEARIAARLQHPNIAQIYELGEVDRNLFIAMEYVEGESLARFARVYLNLLRERGQPPLMPIRPCAAVIAEAAAGLHAAHELRAPDGTPLELVHRDVSPHNILVTYDGYVKLIDFGVAKARGRITHTQDSAVKGKIAYMSPEQLQARPLDRRSDIFALGIVLHEMTCGRRLFKSELEAGTIAQIINAEVPRPSSLRADYPPALEAVVLKALARDPAARFQTAEQMRQALLQALHQSGPPVSASDVAALMQTTFADRIQRKARLRDAREPLDRDNSDVSALVGRSDTLEFASLLPGEAATVATPSPVGSGPVRPRRSLAVPGAAAVAVLVLGLLGAWLWPRTPAAAPVGNLQIASLPSGATVTLDDGAQTGQTPARFDGLALGAHTLRVELAGHRPWQKQVEITAGGQELVLEAPLQVEPPPALPAEPSPPAASPPAEVTAPPATPVVSVEPRRPATRRTAKPTGSGKLTLKTHPWSEVWLGKRKLGITPLVGLELPAGSQRLRVLPEGKEPAQQIKVQIVADEHLRREVKLR